MGTCEELFAVWYRLWRNRNALSCGRRSEQTCSPNSLGNWKTGICFFCRAIHLSSACAAFPDRRPSGPCSRWQSCATIHRLGRSRRCCRTSTSIKTHIGSTGHSTRIRVRVRRTGRSAAHGAHRRTGPGSVRVLYKRLQPRSACGGGRLRRSSAVGGRRDHPRHASAGIIRPDAVRRSTVSATADRLSRYAHRTVAPHPAASVTFAEFEQARSQMPDGWVPIDSWNTPGQSVFLLRPVLHRRVYKQGRRNLRL